MRSSYGPVEGEVAIPSRMRSTTVLAVRDARGRVAMAGDGQVTLGTMVAKSGAVKVRRIYRDQVLAGFAGASGDALAVLEVFEKAVAHAGGNVARAAVDMVKRWRTDRYLRRLDAMLLAATREDVLLIGGGGEVVAPDDGIAAIGSGSGYAVAAARALSRHTDRSAGEVARAALQIAAELCIYTNENITVLDLDGSSDAQDGGGVAAATPGNGGPAPPPG